VQRDVIRNSAFSCFFAFFVFFARGVYPDLVGASLRYVFPSFRSTIFSIMSADLNFSIRLASNADIPALHQLIETSVRTLQRNDYTPEQIEGALGTVLGLDTQLVADGTYFIAEARAACARILAGCGGWSKRKTLFGSDHAQVREPELLDSKTDAAKIRAFFIHPDFARRGIGTKILEACESAARTAGFRRFEMGATLTGVPLYLARGYQILDRIEVPLCNGHTLPVVRMSKSDLPKSP
jgi:N-acetylglutamate synthase-like GNAT family acetyltransferase